jgi:hypothetical protein
MKERKKERKGEKKKKNRPTKSKPSLLKQSREPHTFLFSMKHRNGPIDIRQDKERKYSRGAVVGVPVVDGGGRQ